MVTKTQGASSRRRRNPMPRKKQRRRSGRIRPPSSLPILRRHGFQRRAVSYHERGTFQPDQFLFLEITQQTSHGFPGGSNHLGHFFVSYPVSDSNLTA